MSKIEMYIDALPTHIHTITHMLNTSSVLGPVLAIRVKFEFEVNLIKDAYQAITLINKQSPFTERTIQQGSLVYMILA